MVGHFDPNLMRTYQQQYSLYAILFIIGVEKCWDRELSQICHSVRAYVLMLMRW